MTEALTITESAKLTDCERIIESGLQTFVEVGTALSEIRDSKLYRMEYGTFEDYCRERWGMSRSYAHRMIDSSEVVQMLPMGNIPTSERQARPLAKLPAAEQAPAWQDAVQTAKAEERKVTAKDVEQAVERRTSATFNPTPNTRPPDPLSGKVVLTVDDNAPDDPPALAGLKRYWRTANKKERKAFLAWCEE
jgi:hypothetical protein